MPERRTCYQCRRPIRLNSATAIYLFLVPLDNPAIPGEEEAWVCGVRCLDAYNDNVTDVRAKRGARVSTQVYSVGDRLPDGRVVKEVDENGKILILGPKPRAQEPPQEAAPAPAPTASETSEPQPSASSADSTPSASEPASKKKTRNRKPKAEPEASTMDAVVAEKLRAARGNQPAEETSEEDESAPAEETEEVAKSKEPKKAKTQAKTPRAKTPKAAKPAKAKGARKTRWTDESIKEFKQQISDGKATYATIAAKLGVTPQTVWASLNKNKLSRNNGGKPKAKRASKKR